MQTRALRSLVRISRTNSFRDAAHQLNMTLSALSMQMKTLERDLGVALFDRGFRPPRLTPMGREVVARAAEVLDREAALLEVCQPSATLVGRFRLGLVTTAAVRLLPAFLKAAQADMPLARFDFETGLSETLQEEVLSGRLDAAVVNTAGAPPPHLVTIALRQEPFAFAAHASLLGAGWAAIMEGATFFHFLPQTGIGAQIAAEMKRHDRAETARTVMLDNLEAIMGCVGTGLGFTLLPRPDVERYAGPELVLRDGPSRLRRSLVLAVHADGPLAKRAGLLARHLRG